MKNSRHSPMVLALITTVSGAAMLMACDGRTNLDSLFGDDRPEQVVEYNRHPPALNPRMAPPAPPQAMQAQPPARPVEVTPYDRYQPDDSGSVVELSEEEAQRRLDPNAPPEESNTLGNMFGGWFGSSQPAPAGAPQTAPRSAEPRKPLQGNPRVSMETEPVAPVPPGPETLSPVVEAEPVLAPARPEPAPASKTVKFLEVPARETPKVSDTPPAPVPVTAVPAPAAPQQSSELPVPDAAPVPVIKYESAEPAMEAEPEPEPIRPVISDRPVEPPVSRPSFMSRMMSPFYRASDEERTPQAPAPSTPSEGLNESNKLSYPELSSVPPVPEEFQAVKSDRQDQMEELQGEHMNAMQAQQELMSEPSEQQQPPAPVMLLGEGVSALEMGTDEGAPPVSDKAPVKPAPRTDAEPPPPAPVAAPVNPPAPGETEVLLGHAAQPPESAPLPGEAIPVVAAPAAKPQTLDAQMTRLQSPKDTPNLQPQTPLPAPVEMAPPPPAAPDSSELPVLAPAAPPEVAATEGAPVAAAEEEEEPAMTPSSTLPSVKMLPPSRYQSRERATRPATY